MALCPKTRLGRYELRTLLGVGGMGEVYLAEDTELERLVALKVLPVEVSQDAARIRRFVQEAKAASALNHPNILTIYEISTSASSRFIASEFIKGETLRQRLKREQLGLRETLGTAIQIAAALAAAHEAGIVHRDIKPENIMLREDGWVKVLDFGLAKLTEKKFDALDTEAETRALVQTIPGVVMGTVHYMSPEQARGKDVDARTDIFSFGVVLYEMLAGRLPFEGETANDIIAALLKSEPVPLSQYGADVPKELERIIGKALRKNREERYQHIEDLLLDLKDLKQELEFAAKLECTAAPVKEVTEGKTAVETEIQNAQTTSSAEYVVSEIKNHKLVLLPALLVLLLTLGGLGFWYFGNRSTNTKSIVSIAVLPFENGSGDANLDYLSDGVSESVLDRLSQLPQLKVIARSSSFKYRGQNVDFKEVANALGVEILVTGRIVLRGDNYSIRVDLVDASDNRQLWGENFNRRASDVQLLQADISREIADNLSLRLTGAQTRQLVSQGTTNPQAYELLLKGRFAGYRGVTEGRKKAHEYFQQAIAVDPNYALAYAELSSSYFHLLNNGILTQNEVIPKAEEAAQKALSLNERLAEAHLAMATLKRNFWDWATAEREYNRAIELNPNMAEAHSGYANYLSLVGRHEQAIAEIKRARELDPLSLSVNMNVGFRFYFARQYDQAIEVLKKTLELDQNYPNAYITLGYVYAAKGMYREAIAAYQKAISLGDDSLSTQIYLGAAYAQAGEREKAQAILKRMQMSGSNVSLAELAIIYIALGEREQTLTALESAYAAHDNQLQFLGVDPNYDSLHSDPRFQDILRRVGVPQ